MTDTAVDVVVVGYGGAGGMAAIAAHDAGARVLLVEKMDEGGGSTHEAGGTVRPPRDAVLAAQHYAALSGGTTPLEVMETFARAEAELPAVLSRLGGRTITPGRDAHAHRGGQRHQQCRGQATSLDRDRTQPAHAPRAAGQPAFDQPASGAGRPFWWRIVALRLRIRIDNRGLGTQCFRISRRRARQPDQAVGDDLLVPADLADFSVMFSRFPLCRHDFDARERDRAVSRRKSSPVDSSIACGQLRP